MIVDDERIERRIEGLDSEKYFKLKDLCRKVSDFINEYCTQHTSVVITQDDFVVKEDVVNGYFEMRN